MRAARQLGHKVRHCAHAGGMDRHRFCGRVARERGLVERATWSSGPEFLSRSHHASLDPPCSVYDARSLQLVHRVPTATPVTSMDVSYDQSFMTTAEGKTVRFFDASNLRLIKEHQLAHNAEAASYCPSRGRFVAGGEDMWVHQYDFVTGQVSMLSDDDDVFQASCFCPIPGAGGCSPLCHTRLSPPPTGAGGEQGSPWPSPHVEVLSHL